jgi:hypothetical protein
MAPVQAIKTKKWLLFCLIALWLSLEYLGLGPFSYTRIHDTGDAGIPRYLSMTRDFFTYGVTYWVSNMGCGVDRLSNDMLYPHVIATLYGVFPGWVAYGLFIFLKFFLAGYFTYRVSKDDLGMSEISSIYAGTVFSFYSNDLMSLQLGFAAFPSIVWALGRLGKDPGVRRWFGILALAIIYSFCSSLPWSLPFGLVSLFLWFLFVIKKRSYRSFLSLIIFSLVTVAVQFPEIWALVLNGPSSHRADWSFGSKTQPLVVWGYFREGLTVLLQDKLSLILAGTGIFLSRLHHRTVAVLAVCCIVYALGIPVINSLKAVFLEELGFLRGYQFDRFYELVPFFAALSGGLGLELMIKRVDVGFAGRWSIGRFIADRKASAVLLCVVFVVLGVLTVRAKKLHVYTWITDGSYVANYRSSYFENLKTQEEKNGNGPFRVATVNERIHAAYANAYGLETVDGYINLYPKTYQKFWAKVIEPMTQQDNRLDHYFNDWGNRIYLFRPENGTGEIVFSHYYRLNLLSLANTKYVISRTPLRDENLVPIVEQAQPWKSLPGSEQIRIRLKENFEGRTFLNVYENKVCFPRFFVARRKQVFRDSAELLDAMSQASLNVLKETVFVEEGDVPTFAPTSPEYRTVHLSVERNAPDKIELSVEMNGSGVLIASNSYNPFWKCRVDGVRRKIFRAYGTFWGVPLDKNDRKLIFEYSPPYRLFGRPSSST